MKAVLVLAGPTLPTVSAYAVSVSRTSALVLGSHCNVTVPLLPVPVAMGEEHDPGPFKTALAPACTEVQFMASLNETLNTMLAALVGLTVTPDTSVT